MNRKMKILCMAALLAAIVAASTMLAAGMKKLSGYLLEKVQEEAARGEDEEETEQGTDVPEETADIEKERREKEFQDYRNKFSPPVRGMSEENRDFINGDTKASFLEGLADTLFMEYGRAVDVAEVLIGNCRNRMNGEVAYEISVRTAEGTGNYVCAYNPAYGSYIITKKEAGDVLQTE